FQAEDGIRDLYVTGVQTCALPISSSGTVIDAGYYPALFRPRRKSFTTRRPSSLTRHGWIRLSPIVQNSPLLPPVGVWAVSQSQCGWSFSQTSYGSSPW